ncbi:hypothetical protein KKC83_04985 [Patescibacteria group bacterium]|nr:hypothetical protein [Patescibacteria group bacterium]MCG2697875.1 hypothetical protein [Candidatus Parcubacteria bacterium]MBU4015695.1 hypothetical protein [Patescibacteria group bacterium]MBU4026872.1 hypothetical protein [Patescibacteria group bacterium]MBU4073436.1 hypothetical protein [Patescibacteria group bacterium]
MDHRFIRNKEERSQIACNQLEKAVRRAKTEEKRKMLEKQIRNTVENLRNLLDKEG